LDDYHSCNEEIFRLRANQKLFPNTSYYDRHEQEWKRRIYRSFFLKKELRSLTEVKGKKVYISRGVKRKSKYPPGDKLAAGYWEKKKGEIYCFSSVKVEELTGMEKNLLGPVREGMEG
jgi:hypothetical protein